MPEEVNVPLPDLLVDRNNARIKDEQPSEQAAILAVAKQQGKRLLKLAADIVEHGLDPTSLPAVVATDDQRARYLVLEGNRRVVVLKGLETPSLISPAFDSRGQKRFNKLSKRYQKNPVNLVRCVLFDSEEEVEHWITLRHTGQNEGVGLVEWGADEKDRYAARHGTRSPAGQIMDLVEKSGLLSDEATGSDKGIITSLKRLINTPTVRERLGIEKTDGQMLSWYPAEETAKGLARIVDDLKTERIKVGDIYHAEQRHEYVRSIPEADLPDPSTRLPAAVPIDDLEGTPSPQPSTPPPKKKKTKRVPDRTAVIPKGCQMTIAPPRINLIYNELSTLSVDQYPNACSVTFRVLVELSTDHYLAQNNVMPETERLNTNLAKRLKAVAKDLRAKNLMDVELERAVKRIADSQLVLCASLFGFNQYVHNKYVFPKATELKVAWDEMQPFLEKVWP